jgi:pantoate--beta-alanine ligase
MQSITSIAELRETLGAERKAGHRIAFVPTMGNLHEGHLDLVRHAQQLAEIIVVSIFVNPLQFGANEDLDNYPRTEAEDQRKLLALGVDYVFLPSVEEMYPAGEDAATRVTVPESMGSILCGQSRPIHFEGVTTVVCKLFNMVQPDVAVFGRKDRQQLAIIRKMAHDLCIPVQIEGVDTRREDDGLAMSSRNNYLSEKERKTAHILYKTLVETKDKLLYNKDILSQFAQIESDAKAQLEAHGFKPDYFSVLDAETLSTLHEGSSEVAVFAAAYLGNTRLIDNVTFVLKSDTP